MIKIFIFKEEEKIVGFQIKGHSGYEEQGKDIVCSGVSSVSQMALVGLTEVLNLKVESEMKDGFLTVYLEEKDVSNISAQAILSSMEKTLEDITKNYARFVKMEVKKRCL